MIMIAIRDYIKLQGCVDLHNIANHFRLPESAVIQMLGFWVNKGIIKRINKDILVNCPQRKCSGCGSCNSISTEIYVWQ